MRLTDEEIRRVQNGTFFGSSTFAVWPKIGKYVKIKYHVSRFIDDPYLRGVLKQVFDEFHKHTCLRFIEDKTKDHDRTPHIKFVDGPGCSSPVGRRLEQTFNGRYVGNKIMVHNEETSSCWHFGIILHEVTHSIGFFHEQSRPDRDNYVDIVWENIKRAHGKDMSFNFRKEKLIDSLGHPYDYLSVMHYGQYAFGNGKVTIRTKDPAFQDKIGQRDGFSKEDISQINDLYKCFK